MVAAPATSRLATAVGRRRALLLNNVPYLLGAAGMAFAPTFSLLLAARTLSGIGVGMSSTLVNLYIGELAPTSSRGKLGAVAPFAVTAGILVSYLASYGLAHASGDLGWRLMLGLAGIPPVIQLLGAVVPDVMPESPRWLLQRGRRAEARRVLALLLCAKEGASLPHRKPSPGAPHGGDKRTQDVNKDAELSAVQQAVDAEMDVLTQYAEKSRSSGAAASTWSTVCELVSRHPRALLTGIGLNVLQQVSGVNVVVYFAPTVLLNAGFVKQTAILLTAAVGGAQLLATGALMGLVDRFGRKALTLFGLVGMIAGLAALGVSFLPSVKSSAVAKWLAVGSVLVFRVMFSFSLGPLPYIITAEVFPPRVSSVGVGVSWACNWLANFGVSLSFLPVETAVGAPATFFGYTGFCLLAVAFVVCCVKETAGVRLENAGGSGDDAAAVA